MARIITLNEQQKAAISAASDAGNAAIAPIEAARVILSKIRINLEDASGKSIRTVSAAALVDREVDIEPFLADIAALRLLHADLSVMLTGISQLMAGSEAVFAAVGTAFAEEV